MGKNVEPEIKVPVPACIEEKCRYCEACLGVNDAHVTLCAEGHDTTKRCHRFEILCMESQYPYLTRKVIKA